MSRLSQLYWFLNEETIPDKIQQQHHYTSLAITDEIKAIRREHLRLVRKAEKEKAKMASIPEMNPNETKRP